MRRFFLIGSLLFTFLGLHSQSFGYGFTFCNDVYQWLKNPKDDIASPSAGSAILNFAVGPKIWVGSRKVNLTLEAQAGIAPLALATKDYKGLGAVHFPIMAQLNFKGLTTMDREGQTGFSIGGGIQYNRTELWGLDPEYETEGVRRKFFQTYIAQLGYGFGMVGFSGKGFLRYGWNADRATSFSVGLQWDFNYVMMKKISTKENSL